MFSVSVNFFFAASCSSGVVLGLSRSPGGPTLKFSLSTVFSASLITLVNSSIVLLASSPAPVILSSISSSPAKKPVAAFNTLYSVGDNDSILDLLSVTTLSISLPNNTSAPTISAIAPLIVAIAAAIPSKIVSTGFNLVNSVANAAEIPVIAANTLGRFNTI